MVDQEPQPSASGSELASFGEELRREREIRGISLKEIADATKISKRFLEALERNDHRTLPAPVFTRGFVREYARYVGLNAEEMVNRYNFAAANDDRIEKPPHVERHPAAPVRDITPKAPPKRGIPPAYARINMGAVVLVLIIIALGGVAYWAIQHKRDGELGADINATPPVSAAKNVVAPPVVPPAPKPADDSVLRLGIEVTADSWIDLKADGKPVFHDVLAHGEHRSFEAQQQFRFDRIGNAAGVQLTLNGTRVPPLGGDGEVVKNRVFDRDTLRQLRAAPQTATASSTTAPTTTAQSATQATPLQPERP
ncbi:MAG: DUF4115 domain-containing protein [Acidobacteria bacterium]|nr:DUF4115 domain-containing protein [Acidobacteriota bacterium]MBV9477842.1 DUF4115 domain-containing protein [Acidobacteriota bacterium]